MSTNTKPVAKSLHTVTVLVQVARLHINSIFHNGQPIGATPSEAVDKAMVTIGLAGRDDPYNLRAAALKQLEA